MTDRAQFRRMEQQLKTFGTFALGVLVGVIAAVVVLTS